MLSSVKVFSGDGIKQFFKFSIEFILLIVDSQQGLVKSSFGGFVNLLRELIKLLTSKILSSNKKAFNKFQKGGFEKKVEHFAHKIRIY